MGEGDGGVGHQLLDFRGYVGDVLYLIVNIIDLPAPGQFPVDGFPDDFRAPLHDEGLDGHAVDGGLFQKAHIPDAGQAHVEGPRDGGRRKGEDVDILLQLLDLLLVGDPEALFLINN